MISKQMEQALNGQINKEFYSAYLYLAMGAYSETKGLGGFANWFRNQAMEESAHAMKFFSYVHEQGGTVVLDAIQKPPAEFDSIIAVFRQTLEHEQFVTKSINGLVDLAIEEKDHATNSFLKWFVDEQVEEESGVQEILSKLEMVGGEASSALLMIDRESGARALPTVVTQMMAGQ